MSDKYPGGFVTLTTPTGANAFNPALGSAAPGVWTIDQAMYYTQNRLWPIYDPYFNQTTLMLHGNGTNGAQNNTFLDSSSNNFTITRNGNTTQGTYTPFSSGWSNYFNGSSDYLTSSHPALNATFTIEAWVYRTSGSANQSIVFLNSGGVSGVVVYIDTSNFLVCTDGVTGQAAFSNLIVPINAWAHVAIVRSGGTTTGYVNGVVAGSNSFTPASVNAATIARYAAASPLYFPGYISNVRVVNGSAVYTANFTPPTSPLTAITNTSFLTCQSNRFIDNSTNAFAITVNGTPSVQSFAPFAPQYQYQNSTATNITWSNYFNNTPNAAADSYLEIPYNTAFNLGTNNFTMEGWIFISATPSQEQYIFGNPGANVAFVCTIDTLRRINFYLYPTGGSSPSIVTSNTSAAPINAWTHVAVVKEGSTIRLYINGSQYFSSTASIFGAVNAPNVVLRIAGVHIAAGTPYNFVGSISNFRIVNGTCLYPSGTTFTPSSTPLTAIPNTILLTCQSSTFVDNSSYNFPITVNNVTSQTTNPLGYTFSASGGSGYFDGSDYLTAPTNAALNLGTGDFTIEGWVYPTANSGDWFIISSTGNSGMFFGVRNSSAPTGFGYGRTGVAWDYVTGVNPIVNTWQHIAITRSGTSIKLFLNGTQIGVTQTSSQAYDLSVTATSIGSQGSFYYLTGYMSSLRVLKGTAAYTANFTPPTAPVTAITNTSLLLNYTNAGIYDAAMDNVLETVGNAQVSTSVVKYGSGSMFFDGTGDYLSMRGIPAFDFGTGNFTIETWANFTTFATPQVLCSVGTGAGAGNFIILVNPTVGFRFYLNTGATDISQGSLTGWSTNTWYHLACVRFGATVTLYRNGIAIASGACSTQVGNIANAFLVGGDTQPTSSNGYYDDFRVTKGLARYTANFTPPQVALPRQ